MSEQKNLQFKLKINGIKYKVRFIEPDEILQEGDWSLPYEDTQKTRDYIKGLGKLSGVTTTSRGGMPRTSQHFTYLRKC